MDRKKIIIAAAAAATSLLTLTAGGLRPDAALTAAIGTARSTAYLSAGIRLSGTSTVEAPPSTEESSADHAGQALESAAFSETDEPTEESPESAEDSAPEENSARVISRNILDFSDGVNRTAKGTESGVIVRERFGGYQGDDYIKLPGGGLVWNPHAHDGKLRAVSACILRQRLPEPHPGFRAQHDKGRRSPGAEAGG